MHYNCGVYATYLDIYKLIMRDYKRNAKFILFGKCDFPAKNLRFSRANRRVKLAILSANYVDIKDIRC